MTPAAVDIIKLTKLEPPAPTAAPQGPRRGEAPTFQDHLAAAGRKPADQLPKPPDEPADPPFNENEPADSEPVNQVSDTSSEVESSSTAETEEATQPNEQVNHDAESGDDTPLEPVDASQAVAIAIVQIDEPVTAGVVESKKEEPTELPDAVEPAAKQRAAEPHTQSIEQFVPKPMLAEETPVDAEAAMSVAAVDATTASEVVEQVPIEQYEAAIEKRAITRKSSPGHKSRPIDDESEVTTTGEIAASPKPDVPEAEIDTANDTGTSVVAEKASRVATNVAAPNPAVEVVPQNSVPTDTIGAQDRSTHATAPQVAVAPQSNSPIDAPSAVAEPSARSDQLPPGEGPRNSPYHSLEKSANSQGEPLGGISQADRIRILQRVAKAVQTAHDRGGELKLRLSPPELGSLRLQVRITDGALSARIEADSSQAKQVLIDNLPALRERLAEQNIRVERFDVDLSNSGNNGTSQNADHRFDDRAQHNPIGGTRQDSRNRDAATSDAKVERQTGTPGDGRLNVVV